MLSRTIKQESQIIEAFRDNNVRRNTIHFYWDRMSETPADFILHVMTRNVINGEIFLLKTVYGDTHSKCLDKMIDYIKNDDEDESWEVKWKDYNNAIWISHFMAKDEKEVRYKFNFITSNKEIISIHQMIDD